MKGVAGNIGITEVQSAAQKLEKAIREGQDTVSALLEEFASVMGTQVHAIETSTARISTYSAGGSATFAFQWRSRRRRDRPARGLLEASDGDAEESFRSLQEAVAGAVEKPQLDALERIDQRLRF